MEAKKQSTWWIALIIAAAVVLVALGQIFAPKVPEPEKMVAVSVMAYNHIENRAIRSFSVNGAGGPPIPPYHGGGSFTCCVRIPEHWKPGLQARVYWNYGGDPPDAPPQTATVDIPEYTPANRGSVQVHFYPNHRVLVISTRYSLGHPYNPLPKEDWAPWDIDELWAESQKWEEEQSNKLKKGEKK